MRARIVARVYAETLLRLASRDGAVDEIAEGMRTIGALLQANERFARFVEAPQIAADDKRRVLDAALGGRVHPVVLRFLALVVGKRREDLLGEMAAAFEALLDERAGRQSATVTSAVPADEGILSRVRQALETVTGKTIVLAEDVDPTLLGGIVIRTGDTVIDGSLRTRLATLRRRLATSSIGGST